MFRFLLIFWVASFAVRIFADTKIITAPDGLGYCVTCHGVELKGNPSVDAPNLSVLPGWYVERQLLNFKQGLRAPQGSPDLEGREMRPMAAHLDKAGVQAAINFVDGVPERIAPPTIKGNIKRGKALYQTCAVCHGQKGDGNQ